MLACCSRGQCIRKSTSTSSLVFCCIYFQLYLKVCSQHLLWKNPPKPAGLDTQSSCKLAQIDQLRYYPINCNSIFTGSRADPPDNSSPKMHPTAHMSLCQEYFPHWRRISGALYHSVTTLGVYLPSGMPTGKRWISAFTEWPGQTEVREFETSLLIQQDIWEFNVPVEDKILTQIVYALEQLNHNRFYVAQIEKCVILPHSLNYFYQVRIAIFKN